MQNYGIVAPGNSSAMLIFSRTPFLKFYFRPNGLNDALFVILFAIKKIMAGVSNCFASTLYLNFSFLLRPHQLAGRHPMAAQLTVLPDFLRSTKRPALFVSTGKLYITQLMYDYPRQAPGRNKNAHYAISVRKEAVRLVESGWSQ